MNPLLPFFHPSQNLGKSMFHLSLPQSLQINKMIGIIASFTFGFLALVLSLSLLRKVFIQSSLSPKGNKSILKTHSLSQKVAPLANFTLQKLIAQPQPNLTNFSIRKTPDLYSDKQNIDFFTAVSPFSLSTLRNSFEIAFTNKRNGALYSDLILKSINSFSNYLEQNDKDSFKVTACFAELDRVLSDHLFKKLANGKLNLMLHEGEKGILKPLQALFPLLETYISAIEKNDSLLATRLKIKFANLPVKMGNDVWSDGRLHFPRLFLSESNQLTILVNHFQSKEDKKVDKMINGINKIPKKYMNKMAKLLSNNSSRLSAGNRIKLQKAFEKVMQLNFSPSWNQYKDVSLTIQSHFSTDVINSVLAKEIEKLWRMSKAKQFFANQLGIKEEEINIPRWYHATKHHPLINYFDSIIAVGKIEVMHIGTYKGAWLSNRREAIYGNSVLSFTSHIAKIDPKAHIRTSNPSGVRWRGWQKPIPFVQEAQPPSIERKEYLSLVGIGTEIDKKIIKADIVQKLHKLGIKNPTVISVKQVDYTQKNIFKAIGCPNLSEKWWGEYSY